jgi:hypothetical protein
MRARLAKNPLEPLLPGDRSTKQEFIRAAEEVLAEMRPVIISAHLDDENRSKRLGRLAVVYEQFAAAISSLDENTRSLLEQEVIVLQRNSGKQMTSAEDAARSFSDRLQSIAAHSQGDLAIVRRLAETTAARPEPEIDQTVRFLAQAYENAFGQQPSWTAKGTFARILKVLFEPLCAPGGRPVFVGQSRLRAILSNMPSSSPAPRRGRRSGQNTTTHRK